LCVIETPLVNNMTHAGARARIAVLCSGPGGLLAALLAKRGDPGREVTVEVVAELPVTKVGKLDKKALRDMLAGRSTP
jgi:acyl-CoA synthetase (AMP-forming)/AMP-acid ligase II